MEQEKTSSESISQPTTILCIGMAGSGKTTFVQRINSHLHTIKKSDYVINLDPAVATVPYGANIDIRDTVNYKQVMKQYELGPNGGILTALNLFTTKFDQVLGLLEKRASSTEYIIVDTPGQIEVFTWSASGAIITETLAASYPTVVAYVIDTARCVNPATFMSNMLYACSIMYKTKLPFILVFNKTDVVDCSFALEWMQDYEAFQRALQDDGSYMGSLINSMCLVLEEFYKTLRVVGVSAVTGSGIGDFFTKVDEAVKEYENDYKPELEKIMQQRQQKEEERKKKNLSKLMQDLEIK